MVSTGVWYWQHGVVPIVVPIIPSCGKVISQDQPIFFFATGGDYLKEFLKLQAGWCVWTVNGVLYMKYMDHDWWCTYATLPSCSTHHGLVYECNHHTHTLYTMNTLNTQTLTKGLVKLLFKNTCSKVEHISSKVEPNENPPIYYFLNISLNYSIQYTYIPSCHSNNIDKLTMSCP